jgi:site-specific DNA-methyltransferase (adenine-specific)
MQAMAAMSDNAYDLAIVDPPYGLGATEEQGFGDKRLKRESKEGKWGNKTWDDNRPPKNYFNELIRVAKNQIVFGANYYTDFLPVSKGWAIWDKVQRVDQSDAELIWTSFDSANRIFQFHRSKLQGFQNPNRFHPTEKPIQL